MNLLRELIARLRCRPCARPAAVPGTTSGRS